jgi:predicted transcriptional regulator
VLYYFYGGDEMTRQLNLRVNDLFADAIERLSQATGRPMSSVLEAVGWPAIEAAEEDLKFEADALAAWQEYELTGEHVTSDQIESLFDKALDKAAVAHKRNKK